MTVDEYRASVPILNPAKMGINGSDIEKEKELREAQETKGLRELRILTKNCDTLMYWYWRLQKDLGMSWNDVLAHCVNEFYLREQSCLSP